MVLKLFGSPVSTCTRRVAVLMYEKMIPFELVQVDVAKGEHKSAAYTEKQPFGQIPYLVSNLGNHLVPSWWWRKDDDGFIVYESRAICRYLEDKFPNQGPKLMPTDPKKRAIFEQAASVEVANFDAYASKAVSEMLFKPWVEFLVLDHMRIYTPSSDSVAWNPTRMSSITSSRNSTIGLRFTTSFSPSRSTQLVMYEILLVNACYQTDRKIRNLP